MKRTERLDDFEESLRLAMDGSQSSIWTALPGIVLNVDLEQQTMQVQPAIQGVLYDKDGNSSNVTLPVIADVPIVWPRSGGFSLTFPIKPNDEVLVIFASRCIDAWFESGGVSAQSELRMHDLSDGFAILSPTSQPNKLSNVSTTNVQLRNDIGTSFVEITPTGAVNIKSTGNISVEGTNVEMKASATATITAPAIILNGTVTGGSGGGMSLGSGGIVSASGSSVTIDGKPYETHKHSGVQTGGGITGPVV